MPKNKQAKRYRVLVGCQSDEAGRFEIGETIPVGTFSSKTEREFVDQGVLSLIVDEEVADGNGKD